MADRLVQKYWRVLRFLSLHLVLWLMGLPFFSGVARQRATIGGLYIHTACFEYPHVGAGSFVLLGVWSSIGGYTCNMKVCVNSLIVRIICYYLVLAI
jgi:hypothetical protein